LPQINLIKRQRSDIMFSKSAKSTATDNIGTLKNLIKRNAPELLDAGRSTIKDVQKSYPDIADKVTTLFSSAKSQSKDALQSFSKDAGANAIKLGLILKGAEKSALKIGFVYAVYKLFVANDERVYETSQKVKAKIKERPVEATLIAVGAGLLLGKLWR
jgi:hypothetical protein